MFALPYFSFLYFFTALIALLIASYTDIKERIVSDKLSYGLIAIGIILHAIEAVLTGNLSILIVSVGITIATFIAGYALWLAGAWAGGDVKLFTGIAAVCPTNPAFLWQLTGIETIKAIGLQIFPLTLFVFSVFAALPYGMLIALRALKQKKQQRMELAQKLKKNALRAAEFSLAATAITQIILALGQNVLLVLPALVVLGLLPKIPRIAIIVLVCAFSIWQQPTNFVIAAVSLFAGLLVFVVLLLLAFETKSLLTEKKKISELQEGDIVAETILLEEGKLKRYEGIKIGKIISYVKTGNVPALKEMLQPRGTVICSHRRAGGLSIEEINKLKELEKKGLLEESIELKKSTAFVPTVLIAFVFLNLVGDLFWKIIFR